MFPPPAAAVAGPSAIRRALARARDGKPLDQAEAAILLQARGADLAALTGHAGRVRDSGLAAAGRPTLSWGFCHGDPCAANARIKDGVTTFFDFDFCGASWRSYDLANFLWALSLHKDPKRAGKWKAFLDGYRSQRPLRRDDLAAVPLFVAARQLWLLGLQLGNLDRWGRWWVNDAYFDFHLKLLWDWASFRMPKLQ